MSYTNGMNTKTAGFSLVELMIGVAVIAILASVVYTNINKASDQSRDAKRQADLRNLQNAVELYNNKYGRYPAGCNGASGDAWSGQIGADYECGGSNNYIVGLAPEFIPVLPKDPKLNGDDSGYVYLTNADGSSYKITAYRTVEAFPVYWGNTYTKINDNMKEFRFCGPMVGPDVNAFCKNQTAYAPVDSPANWCRTGHASTRLYDSYAMIGGYALAIDEDPSNDDHQKDTETVWCGNPGE